MIRKIKYPVIILSSFLLILLALNYFNYLTDILTNSFLYASYIIIINFLLFFTFWEFSHNKPNKTFLIFNLGGMAFRLIITLIGVFVVIKFLNIDKYGFIFALFIWYILFIAYEINLFRKKIEKPLKSSKI